MQFVPCWTTWLSIGPNIHPLYIKTIGVAPLYRALRDCSNWYNEINVPQSKEIKLHRLTPVVRTCCRYQAYNWNEEQMVLSNEKWQKSISKPSIAPWFETLATLVFAWLSDLQSVMFRLTQWSHQTKPFHTMLGFTWKPKTRVMILTSNGGSLLSAWTTRGSIVGSHSTMKPMYLTGACALDFSP